MMIYCRWCKQDVDPNSMDESIYIHDISYGQPLRASVMISLSCPDCSRVLLEGSDEVELYYG